MRAGEVFVKCTEKTGFPGFGFSWQGDNPDLRDRRRLPEERMQLAGPEDRGCGYTESNPGVQNGNPGLYNDETESQSHCDIPSYSAAYADLRDNQEVAACKYAEVIFGRPEG
jgi:hypothetical protein